MPKVIQAIQENGTNYLLMTHLKGEYAYSDDLFNDANSLFTELGVAPDWEKIKYYILLDELF